MCTARTSRYRPCGVVETIRGNLTAGKEFVLDQSVLSEHLVHSDNLRYNLYKVIPGVRRRV